MIFIILAIFVVGSQGIVCPPHACDSVQCTEDVSACPKENLGTGFCGCCPTCITMLGEGDACNMFAGILLGVPGGPVCRDGLHCIHGKCTSSKRSTGPCAEKYNQVQQQLLSSQQNGMPLLGLKAPNCNSDGDYEPKQCAGSVCYCVMKDGSQIGNFRANIWEANTQTCQCARDQAEYMATGLIGRLFHCTDNGNYQTYQCMGSVCYCVDSNGNQKGDKTASIGAINDLVC